MATVTDRTPAGRGTPPDIAGLYRRIACPDWFPSEPTRTGCVAVFGFTENVVAPMTALELSSKNDVQPATENGLSLFYTFETDGDVQILRAFEPDPDVLIPAPIRQIRTSVTPGIRCSNCG